MENGIRLGADKLASIGRIINCPILALFSFPPTKKPIPAERLSDFSPVDKSRRGRKSSVDLFINRLPLACRSAATDSIPGYRASKLNRRHLLTSPSSSSTFIVPLLHVSLYYLSHFHRRSICSIPKLGLLFITLFSRWQLLRVYAESNKAWKVFQRIEKFAPK